MRLVIYANEARQHFVPTQSFDRERRCALAVRFERDKPVDVGVIIDGPADIERIAFPMGDRRRLVLAIAQRQFAAIVDDDQVAVEVTLVSAGVAG